MNKILLGSTILGLMLASSLAIADFPEAAFGDKSLENVKMKVLPPSSIEEAPEYAETTNGTEADTVIPNSPVLLSKEYAGAKVWGKVCNIVHTPNGSLKWSINQYDLATDTVETLFGVSNNRKIQSVACSPSGFGIVFSMKESLRGDYEIYILNPGEDESIYQVTNNNTDDVDVTADRNGSIIAWQQRLADGRQAILMSIENPDGGLPITRSLASASPFVQPSLSANGKWMVFVQLRPSYFAVMRYDIENKKYKEIRKIARRKRLFHPSISDDGNIIGWSENRNQNRYMVKNVSENTLTQVLNNPNGIEHATIASTGDLVTYSINTDSKRQTLLTHLHTLETIRVGDIQYDPNRYLGTIWLGNSLQDLTIDEINSQVFVSTDVPFVLSFASDGTGAEFSAGDGEFSDAPDPYADDYTWQITDGKLLISYPPGSQSDSGVVSLVSISGNQYTLVAEESDGEGGVGELLKALPFKVADLDGLIIRDSSITADICRGTIKITGSTAVRKELCKQEDGSEKKYETQMTLAQVPSLENVIEFSFTDEDGQQSSVYFILIEGEVTSQMKFARIFGPSDTPIRGVDIFGYEVTDEEL